MVSAHPIQPFPSPHTSLCTPDTLSCFSLQNSSFLPQGPCRHFFLSVTSPPTFLFLGAPPLLLPVFGDSKRGPCREHELLSNIKGSLVSGDEKEKPVGCLQVFRVPVPPISFSVCTHGRCGLQGAEPAAGCRGHFITHLGTVVNGDFMPPPALIVAAALL